jgi:acetylglutamate synthase
MKVHSIQVNAERAKQKRHRHNTMKPQTNTFSKYCKDNTQKKFDIKYTHIIQGSYKRTVRKKDFCTYYRSFLNI